MPNPSNRVKTESIDEVILRLLGLSSNQELDTQTYFKILRNKLASARLVGKQIPQEEDILLREELKRIKKIKDQGYRFKIKSVKSKDIFSNKVSQNLRRKKITSSSAIVRYKGGPLVKKDEFVSKITSEEDATSLSPIRKTLNYILEVLSSKFKFEKKQSDIERREKETEKRGKRESTLEGFKKGIGAMVNLTKKMMSPFSSLIERIKKFLFFTLLGRAFNSFMNWMNDKENQKKFNALVEFLTDHWPAIAGVYILFGTSFGKLVRGILKGAVRMSIALAMNIPKIIGFIKKHKNLAKIALIASPFVTREVAKIFSDNKENVPEQGIIPSTNKDLEGAKKDTDKAGNSKVPTFNLGGLIPSFAMGGMKPFGMGMDFSSGVPISGAGQDDTLIAAKTGEAILTEKDQVDLSKRYVDRNTGEPLNIPQYLSGRKPGTVSMSNLRFPGFGGGFFKGGMISRFKDGGIVGGKNPKLSNNYSESGLLGNAMNFLGGMFNFGRSATPPSSKPKPRKPLPEYQNPEALSLLRTIRSAEHYRGSNPYNALYGGKSAPVTKMTIQEVIDMGNTGKLPKRFGGQSAGYGSGSAATGAYQFMPFTLQDLIRRGLAKPNEIMSQSVQDRLGWELAKNRGVTLGSLRKSGLSQSIMDMMAPEWASFPYSVSGGKSYYGQPVKGAGFLQQIYSQSLGSFRTPKKQKGGLTGFVGENSGKDIPGATADRQLVALQPGEFVLPRNTVSRLGLPMIEKIVAMTDSNSIAYRQSENRNIPGIRPYTSSPSRNVMTLPPIIQGSGMNRARASGYSGGTRVPSFSHISDRSDRNMIAGLYGIETSTGMV